MKLKVSLIIPVYYNQDNIEPLYRDIVEKLYCHEDVDWEVVMVNDGSMDNSYEMIKRIAAEDSRVKAISLSRNFGSHAAILCGLTECTGDCAVIKAADLQEPTELVIDMIESWKQGHNVVIAEREGREESNSALTGQILWSGFKTGHVKYVRKAREFGTSKWTLKNTI